MPNASASVECPGGAGPQGCGGGHGDTRARAGSQVGDQLPQANQGIERDPVQPDGERLLVQAGNARQLPGFGSGLPGGVAHQADELGRNRAVERIHPPHSSDRARPTGR
ncbi:hypothetical protein JMUB6875_06230 [Nocardia sp. JMUB6875]